MTWKEQVDTSGATVWHSDPVAVDLRIPAQVCSDTTVSVGLAGWSVCVNASRRTATATTTARVVVTHLDGREDHWDASVRRAIDGQLAWRVSSCWMGGHYHASGHWPSRWDPRPMAGDLYGVEEWWGLVHKALKSFVDEVIEMGYRQSLVAQSRAPKYALGESVDPWAGYTGED